MRARSLLLFAAGLLPALTACGVAIRYGAHFADGVEPASGGTFAWNQVADRVVGDPRLHGNRFFEERLHEAIEWQLSLRGIQYDESSPELVVHHHLSLEDHEFATDMIDAGGYRTTEVYAYEQGTVVIHLVDAKTNKNVWVGWAQADIDIALRSPENMRKWVYDLVAQMFEDWPVLERVAR